VIDILQGTLIPIIAQLQSELEPAQLTPPLEEWCLQASQMRQ